MLNIEHRCLGFHQVRRIFGDNTKLRRDKMIERLDCTPTRKPLSCTKRNGIILEKRPLADLETEATEPLIHLECQGNDKCARITRGIKRDKRKRTDRGHITRAYISSRHYQSVDGFHVGQLAAQDLIATKKVLKPVRGLGEHGTFTETPTSETGNQ